MRIGNYTMGIRSHDVLQNAQAAKIGEARSMSQIASTLAAPQVCKLGSVPPQNFRLEGHMSPFINEEWSRTTAP